MRLYDQHALVPALKAERPALAGVQAQVLQYVALRIDVAFKAFFRRVKAGATHQATPVSEARDAMLASPSRRCRWAADSTPRPSSCE